MVVQPTEQGTVKASLSYIVRLYLKKTGPQDWSKVQQLKAHSLILQRIQLSALTSSGSGLCGHYIRVHEPSDKLDLSVHTHRHTRNLSCI